MWTPGMGELLIMLVIVMIIFGAGKLPQVGRSLGEAITEFKGSVKSEDKDKEDESTSAKSESSKEATE